MPAITKDLIAATTSFCLPGLGQVSQGRPVRGLLFFIPFVVTLAWRPAHAAIPIVALVASFDAYFPRRPVASAHRNHARRSVFVSAAFCGLLLWLLLFFSASLQVS